MPKPKQPCYPIIYVRGYAMTSDEIADTVASPYMGLELGATKVRQTWDKKVVRHYFESPIIRLMKDYQYRDAYEGGQLIEGAIPAQSIIIHRYYDVGDEDFGDGKAPSIASAAEGLKQLIYRVRDQVVAGGDLTVEDFKVYLVAHSMGGLIVRAFLQNDKISQPADRSLVDKVFTYATPHNGIEMGGFNVPSVLGLWDMNNFNRKTMAGYLGLPPKSDRVDSLNDKFDPNRFFCLVGSNNRDYPVLKGVVKRLAGEMSDGLVTIENATVDGAPRAFVYRSHSGPYGIVNSEEGYQNLVRFLFGDVRVDGVLVVKSIPLPPSVQKAKDDGKEIRGSYYFEATVAPRNAYNFRLTERRRDTFSAILRTYDDIRADEKNRRDPVLFSTFLDTTKIAVGTDVVFGIELKVSSTGYTIDRALYNQHVDGEYVYSETITVKATPTGDDFVVSYSFANNQWSETAGDSAKVKKGTFLIPIKNDKGFEAVLHLNANWR